jgi:hypothetical protein
VQHVLFAKVVGPRLIATAQQISSQTGPNTLLAHAIMSKNLTSKYLDFCVLSLTEYLQVFSQKKTVTSL